MGSVHFCFQINVEKTLKGNGTILRDTYNTLEPLVGVDIGHDIGADKCFVSRGDILK